MSEEQDEYLTVGDARKLLGVSRGKMTNLIKQGILHTEPNPLDGRQRLIRRSEVERLLKRCPAAA